MSGSHRHDSPGADMDPDARGAGFLARWSARKRASVEDPEGCEGCAAQDSAALASTSVQSPADDPQEALTDRDMPPLETLDAESDYSGFLSPGVSDALRRMALRKLFSTEKFRIRDGLDDYDNDYNLLLPLRTALAEATQDGLTQQVRQQAVAAPDGVEAGSDMAEDEHVARVSEASESTQQRVEAEMPAADAQETES